MDLLLQQQQYKKKILFGSGDAGGEDPDAAAWLDSFTYEPSADERAAYDALVKGLKADGAWTLADAIFVRYSPDQDMALKALKGNFTSSLTGGTPPTWSSKGGITSIATGQLETDFEPSVDGVNFGVVGAGNFSMVYVGAVGTLSGNMDLLGLDNPAGGTTFSIRNEVSNNRIGFNPPNTVFVYEPTTQIQAGKWYSTGMNDSAGTPRTYGYIDAVEVAGPGVPGIVALEAGDVFELCSRRVTAGYNRLSGTIYYSIYGGWGLQALLSEIKSRFDTFKTALDAA